MKLIKILLFITLSYIFISPLFPYEIEGSRSLEIQRANGEYESGNYKKAIEIYRSVISSGFKSAAIFYNLGNCYFRLDKIGIAIFYYRLSERFYSSNPNLKFNLKYVREKAIDKIEDKRGFNVEKLSLRIPVSYKFSIYFFVISFTLFLVFSCIFLFKKNDIIRWTRYILLTLLMFSIFFLSIKYFAISDFGVVTAKKAKVYSAVGKDNIVLFSLHKGAEFKITDTYNNDWIRVKINDGKEGWIKFSDVISTSNYLSY